MQCDLCGKEGNTVQASIEGVNMTVCSDCGKFGKIIHAPKSQPTRFKREMRELETSDVIIGSISQVIRGAREQKGLNQEDFAKLVNEKASIIHKIESGSFKPSIPLAKKLERILGIDLIEKRDEDTQERRKSSPSGALTIGDMIKKR